MDKRHLLVVGSTLLLPLLLAGCNVRRSEQHLNQADSVARANIQLLREHKFDALEKLMSPGIMPVDTQGRLLEMANSFPTETPRTVTTVGSNYIEGTGYTKTEITLEYEFSRKYVLANVVTRDAGDGPVITGFFVNSMSSSLEERNRFTLVGKGVDQYMVLSLGILSLAFSLYAFGVCAKTPNLRKKWLWMLVILVGIGRLAVNWTSGRLDYNVVWISLPTLSYSTSHYAPVFLWTGFPLGALIFMWKRGSSALSHGAKPQ